MAVLGSRWTVRRLRRLRPHASAHSSKLQTRVRAENRVGIYCLLELNMLCDCVTRGCGNHSPLTTAAILEWRRRSAWGGAPDDWCLLLVLIRHRVGLPKVDLLPWCTKVGFLFSTLWAGVFGAPHSECYLGGGTARRVPARLQPVQSCKFFGLKVGFIR